MENTKRTKPRDYVNPKGATIVVRNFSKKLKRDDLFTLFLKAGRVKGVRIMEDDNPRALVHMLKDRDATRAINTFHNRIIDGRKLQVSAK